MKGKWTVLLMFLQVSFVLSTFSMDSYCIGVKVNCLLDKFSQIGKSQPVPVAYKPLRACCNEIYGYCKVSVSMDISSWHFLETNCQCSPLSLTKEQKPAFLKSRSLFGDICFDKWSRCNVLFSFNKNPSPLAAESETCQRCRWHIPLCCRVSTHFFWNWSCPGIVIYLCIL